MAFLKFILSLLVIAAICLAWAVGIPLFALLLVNFLLQIHIPYTITTWASAVFVILVVGGGLGIWQDHKLYKEYKRQS